MGPFMANRTKTPATNGNGKVARLSRDEQVALLSSTLHRIDYARTHGQMYEGNRDLNQVGGYPLSLSYADFSTLYQRDPIAARVVDMVAADTWREPPEVEESVEEREDGDITAFEEAWSELAKRLGVWRKFERADRLARLGRYSVVVIGAGAGDDSALQQPVTSVRAEDVLFLSVYDERHAMIPSDGWNIDPSSPRFGLPEFYDIDLSSGVQAFSRGQTLQKKRVHWSRVLHVAEGLASDEVFGRPVLERIYNALHDLGKVTTSTAEAFYQRVAGILIASVDKDVVGAEQLLEDLDEDLKAVFHDLRRYIVSQGVDLKRLAESEPNPAEAAKLYFTLIAVGEGIPFRVLLGNETGERASSEDMKGYLGMVAGRQKNHAEPTFVRAFVDRLISWKALPDVEYEVVWPPLFEEPETVIAEANQKTAAAAQALTPVGGDPQLLVEVDEDRRLFLVPRKADDPSPFEEMLEEAKEMEREAMEKALQPEPEAQGGQEREAA